MNTIIKKIVLTLSIILLTIPAFAYDFEANGLYFNIVSVPKSTCELVQGDVPYVRDVVIPENVEYKNRQFTIISIGDSFSGNKEITSVVLPNTITEFNGGAFENCTALQTVTFPNNLTSITNKMFYGCSSLRTFTIPNSVTSVGDNAFYDCTSLQSVIMFGSVKYVGDYAFGNCTALTSIILPESLGYLGDGVFSGCTSLQTITIPGSIMGLRKCIFSGCTSLTSITIPGTVDTIFPEAFSGCRNLKEVIFENNQEYICFYYRSAYSSGFEVFLGSIFYDTNISTLVLGRQLNYYHSYETGQKYGKFNDENQVRSLFNNLTTLKVLKDCDPKQISLFSDISHLSFEENVDLREVDDLSSLTKLQTLTLESMIPPACPRFSNNQYLNVILYVPAGTLEAYQNAGGWKYFFDIREVDVSGVKEIQSGLHREIGRYDINGNRVDEDFKGITIVKYSDGSTKKYVNR